MADREKTPSTQATQAGSYLNKKDSGKKGSGKNGMLHAFFV
jgi:hypothetical protein